MKTICRCLVACLVTTSLAAAQVALEPQSQGPFLAAPHGFSLAPGAVGFTGPIDATEILDKRIGLFTGTTPTVAPAPLPGRPDFRTDAILQGISPRPDIDALSMGLDWVLATDDGVVEVPPGNWGAITFSVTRGTLGRSGGVIAGERGRSGGAAGDLFSYILNGGALPGEFTDVVQRAHDSSEFALAPGSVHDIDAHDLLYGLLFTSNPSLAASLPPPLNVPRVFFSVSTATLGDVPAAWWGGTVPSGATVFWTEWTGAAWATPSVFLTPANLGLSDAEEVDAIAIDLGSSLAAGGGSGELLFSTASPGRDPILFGKGFTFPGLPMPPVLLIRDYREADGRKVSDRIGLVSVDDVDAICSVDPGRRQVMRLLMGTPEATRTPPNFQTRIAASVFREAGPSPSSGARLISTMAGWPSSGRGPGFAGCDLAVLAPVGWFPVSPTSNPQRDPTDPRGGGPEHLVVPIPNQPLPFPAPVWFWWGAVDQPIQAFGFGRSLRIAL